MLTLKPVSLSMMAFCCLTTLSVLFYLFYILPHSGLDFADSGLTLYSSLFLVNHHISFDWLAIPRPSFLTAFFMLLGIKSVIFIKLSFGITLILSISLLLISIEKKLWIIIPFASAFGLYNGPLTVGNYENTPVIFLMFSIAFFFFSQHKQNILKHFLIGCSAFFLALSVATNISVLLAGFFAALFLWARHKRQSGLLFFEFMLFFSLIAYTYISFIGIKNISQHFAHTHSSLLLRSFAIRSLSIGFLLLKIILIAAIATYIPKFLFWVKMKTYPSLLWNFTVSMILILGLTPLLKYLFPLYSFSEATQWLPMLALLLLILACCSIINFANFKDQNYIKLLTVFSIGLAYYLCQSLMTNNPILIPLNYYSGLFSAIFLSLFYLHFIKNEDRRDKKISVLFCVIVSFLLWVGIYIQLNFSYGNGKTITNTSELQTPLLKHMYVAPEKKQLITTLYQIYTSQDCNKKSFIAFYDLPILYYLFERNAPLHESWIESWSDDNGFPRTSTAASEKNIMQWLSQQHQNWCVFTSLGLNNKAPDENIQKFLRKNSIKMFKIDYAGAKGNIWVESAPKTYEIFIK